MINAPKIKQILGRLAKRIEEIETGRVSEDGLAEKRRRGLPTIHAGFIVNPELVEARAEALHEISDITEKSGFWGPSSVDYVIWDFIDRIKEAIKQKQQTEMRSIVDAAVKTFSKSPSKWVVDILIYGIDGSCDGTRFGRIQFGRAEVIVDEHLMVLNAICVLGYPSLVQVSRSNRMGCSYSAHPAGGSAASQGPIQSFGHNLKVALHERELSLQLNAKVGSRVSHMLA